MQRPLTSMQKLFKAVYSEEEGEKKNISEAYTTW